MHTEDEAKKKWCPHIHQVAGDPPEGQTFDLDDLSALNCIGSACMAWRWAEPEPEFKVEVTPHWYPYEGEDRPVKEPATKGRYHPVVPVRWEPHTDDDEVPAKMCGWIETDQSVARRADEQLEQLQKKNPRHGYCGLSGAPS
tara:strand:- start:21894 stop:22319 length:426 start_codon:yes stop_codon:yes gene_type:complete